MAESFENGAREFGDFIEEENAEMSEGDFSGLGLVAATDDGNGGGGVMGRAEGAGGDNAVGFAGDGVDFGDGNLLFG